jgi:hypothetical protein
MAHYCSQAKRYAEIHAGVPNQKGNGKKFLVGENIKISLSGPGGINNLLEELKKALA